VGTHGSRPRTVFQSSTKLSGRGAHDSTTNRFNTKVLGPTVTWVRKRAGGGGGGGSKIPRAHRQEGLAGARESNRVAQRGHACVMWNVCSAGVQSTSIGCVCDTVQEFCEEHVCAVCEWRLEERKSPFLVFITEWTREEGGWEENGGGGWGLGVRDLAYRNCSAPLTTLHPIRVLHFLGPPGVGVGGDAGAH
jgi:hypothetical protein